MVAAYAVALQMLLTCMVGGVAAPASGDAFAICYGSHDGTPNDQKPADRSSHHQHCALCSLANAAADVPPHDLGGILQDRFGSSVYWLVTQHIVVAKRRSPQLSQGPPQDA
jgi:hypothetical protein